MTDQKNFKPKNEFLICVDSDGCAVDSMDIKHIACFGPCIIEEWGLKQDQNKILEEWNHINLYSKNRGINRFLGLGMELSQIQNRNGNIEGIEEYLAWMHNTKELSNASVSRAFEETGCEIFKKALHWSEMVNKNIESLPKEKIQPFKNVKTALQKAGASADIVIVSSANEDAVLGEWERFGLLPYVDLCMTQKDGPKASCISKMLEMKYAPNHVLMVGDAPGDLEAARKNGVSFYPILTRHEDKSWEIFSENILPEFLREEYAGKLENQKIEEFLHNLNAE